MKKGKRVSKKSRALSVRKPCLKATAKQTTSSQLLTLPLDSSIGSSIPDACSTGSSNYCAPGAITPSPLRSEKWRQNVGPSYDGKLARFVAESPYWTALIAASGIFGFAGIVYWAFS